MDDVLLGFDIGGTKSAVILGDCNGMVHAREEARTTRPESTMDWLVSSARALCGGTRPLACGISCGGPLSSAAGLILSPPNLPGWDKVPVVAHVRKALGVRAALENDANAAAWAEWHWGLHREVDDLVYLTCGTGQGAGLILQGKLFRGAQDLAGEIGHVRLCPDGPTGYAKAGSVEGYTSGRALGELARIRLAVPHPESVLDGAGGSPDGKAVSEAAIAGDALAESVVRELGRHLGHACAILIDLLNPQRISLGSLAVRLGALLVDEVRAGARDEALPAAWEACEIAPAALGERVQDLAALGVAARLARPES